MPGQISRIALLVLGLALGGCVALHPESRAPAKATAASSTLDRLYFGRAIPRGGQVTDAQWAAFLAEVVTPRFPAGLTVWHTEGQWRDAAGTIVHEPGFVLELIHPESVATDRAVAEIVADYRQRFGQDSVLRVRSHVEAQF